MKQKIEKIISENSVEEYSKSYGDGLFISIDAIDSISEQVVKLLNLPVVNVPSGTVCGKPNCNRPKLDSSPLCAYHFDIANG